MKTKKTGQIPEWLRLERAARRAVEIETGGSKHPRGGAHKLKNKPRRSNTVRRENYDV